MAVAGVNRAGGTIVILIMNAAGGATKSGGVISSGIVNVAGMSATVSVAGNISIAAIVTGIIMTVVVRGRLGSGLTDRARTATIVTKQNARHNRAFFVSQARYSPSASPTSK